MVEDLRELLEEACPDCPLDSDQQLAFKQAKYTYAQDLGVSSETTRRWLHELTDDLTGQFHVDEDGFLRLNGAHKCPEHSTHTIHGSTSGPDGVGPGARSVMCVGKTVTVKNQA